MVAHRGAFNSWRPPNASALAFLLQLTGDAIYPGGRSTVHCFKESGALRVWRGLDGTLHVLPDRTPGAARTPS
jgi:hypothetical protein